MNSNHQPNTFARLIASTSVPQRFAIGVAASAVMIGGVAAAVPGPQGETTGNTGTVAASADIAPTTPAATAPAADQSAPPTSPPVAQAAAAAVGENTTAATPTTPAAAGGESAGGDAGAEPVPADEVDEGESGGGEITPSSDTGDTPSAPQPGDSGELDPVGTQPVDDCVATLAGGDHVAAPSDLVLEPGHMSGELTMRNCGDDDAEVELTSQYFVELEDESFTLTPGEERTVGFSIDRDTQETGAIETKIKVYEVDCCASYVDVHAFKTLIGLDVVASTDLSAGPGVGGCNNDCITTAWLTPNAQNTNIHLRVETDTPAVLELSVDTSAPGEDSEGDPELPSPFLTETSGWYTESWETSITGLAESSDYHLVLRATDESGNSTVVTTPFRSRTPIDLNDQFSGNDPEPGCSYQCITGATLGATDHNSTDLTVTTHTPASITAYVGTVDVVDDGGDLQLPNADVTETSWGEVQEWSKSLSGLAPSTDYSILVRATDANGNESFQAGSFSTAAEPTTPVEVVFERFYVHENGDRVGKGEIAFGWGFILPDGTATSSTKGESKISDGASVGLTSGTAWTYHINSSGHLPTLRVIAGERDGNGHFACPAPFGLDGNCSHAKYSAAEYDGPSLDDIWSMGGCGELLSDVDPLDRCIIIEGPDHGKDHVHFDTVVRFVVG